MVRKLVCLAVLFVPAVLHAQSVQIAQGDHMGSGSVIWRYKNYPNYGQVLTCWHVVNTKEPISVIWKNEDDTRTASAARVLASDEKEDIALLESYFGATPAVGLATTTPPVGSRVFICGYGENIYTERPANIQSIENGHIRLDRPARHGDSGGSIIFDQKIVGIPVMLRTEDYDGLAVPAEKIRSFLSHNAGWKFDPRSIGLPPQESQPPSQQQPPPQQGPPSQPKKRGSSSVRVYVGSDDELGRAESDEPDQPQPASPPPSPQQPAPRPPGVPFGGPAAQPGGPLGIKQPVAGNQPPLNPQVPQQNQAKPAAPERQPASRFQLSTIVMMSTTGVSVTACIVVVIVMLRVRKKSAAQTEEADDDADDATEEDQPPATEKNRKFSAPAGGFKNDDEWYDFWFNQTGAPPPPAEVEQRRAAKARRPPPPAPRLAPPKKPKRSE